MTEPKIPAKKTMAKPAKFKPPVKDAVSCPYGRKGPLWAAGYHTGVDYGAKRGTPVTAVADGVIIAANWGQAYGIHVIIQHGAHRVIYAHLDSKAHLAAGYRVKQGEQIGISGSTGNSTAPHLHLEARVAPYRYAIDSVDPVKALS